MHNGQLAAPRIGHGASARKGLKLRKYPGDCSLTGGAVLLWAEQDFPVGGAALQRCIRAPLCKRL
jgi:hypothetical protein